MEQNHISRLLRRIRTIQLGSLALQVLILAAAGIIAWRLTAQISGRYLWPSPLMLYLPLCALLLYLASRSIAWIAAHDHKTNAIEVDRLYHLKERITTYVELQGSSNPFLAPLIRETAPRLKNISPLRSSGARSILVLPFAILLLLTSAFLILPLLPVPDSVLVKKEEHRRIAEEGKELETFARRLEQKNGDRPELKKLAQEIKALGQELQKPDIDKAEVLKRLNALEEKQKRIQATEQRKGVEELKKALDAAAKSDQTGGEPSADQKAELQQLASEFQQATESKQGRQAIDPNTFDSTQLSAKDLRALKDALKKYQDQKSQAEKLQTELQNTLENARKTTSQGKGKFTSDSRLNDRDVEKGKGGVEDGPGTTNKDSGPSRFNTSKTGKGEYMEDRTKAEYERLYVGQRENARKDPVYLKSHWSKDGDPQYTNIRHFGLDKDPTQQGVSNASTSQNQNESAMRKERVPPSHQEIVKKYFESIENQ